MFERQPRDSPRRRGLFGAGRRVPPAAVGTVAVVAVAALAAALWAVRAAVEPPGAGAAAGQTPRSASPSAPPDTGKPGSPPSRQPPTSSYDPGTSPGAVAVGRLVSAHPDDFTGSYLDATGVVVAVFAPGADEAAWRPRLERAAAGHPLRTARCRASASELARVQAALPDFAWPSGRPVFASSVEPARCAVAVRVESLPAADAEALARRFGDAVVVDEGHRPRRR